MTRFQLWRLKANMLLATLLANFAGVMLNTVFIMGAEGPIPEHIWQNPIADAIDSAFTPLAFIFVFILTLFYEKPIRSFVNAKFRNEPVSEQLMRKAQQRLLNEPFVLMLFSFSMWMLAAILYPTMFWMLGVDSFWVQRSFFTALSTGFITVTVAFFLLEYVLQKRLAPYFFPNGGLSSIPKTLRIRIRTRLAALLFACNLIPLSSIIFILQRITGAHLDPGTALSALQSSIYTNATVFLISGILLTLLVSKNLTQPFGEIIQTLRGIRNGRFDKKVQVTSNDEIGYTGDVINEMTDGLLERQKMRQSLNLAREVQQNLLPKHNIETDGMHIVGKSIYCDETGGDYYDFIPIQDQARKKIGVAIADVAGHGISSALLMATVRSLLRFRTSLPGSLSDIMSDVNRQLVRDVEDSGQFVTMFFLTLDTNEKQIEWVRAGHDPAVIYDPGSDSFAELSGQGIALGLNGSWCYEDNQKSGFAKGCIIFLSTDGVWEATNKKGDMLGKAPIYETIRQNAALNAEQIIDAIFDTVHQFIDGLEIQDDITAVVIKLQK